MFAFGSWQGTAGSQRLELTVANVAGSQHGWEPPGYQVGKVPNCRFPDLETYGSQPGEPEVTIARNCRFPEVRIYVFEAKRLSL